jgi:hypothetical protein
MQFGTFLLAIVSGNQYGRSGLLHHPPIVGQNLFILGLNIIIRIQFIVISNSITMPYGWASGKFVKALKQYLRFIAFLAHFSPPYRVMVGNFCNQSF